MNQIQDPRETKKKWTVTQKGSQFYSTHQLIEGFILGQIKDWRPEKDAHHKQQKIEL